MWAIWVTLLLPLALNACPKSKQSPNLVTLVARDFTVSLSLSAKKNVRITCVQLGGDGNKRKCVVLSPYCCSRNRLKV